MESDSVQIRKEDIFFQFIADSEISEDYERVDLGNIKTKE